MQFDDDTINEKGCESDEKGNESELLKTKFKKTTKCLLLFIK